MTKQTRNKGRFAKKRDSAIHAASGAGSFEEDNYMADGPMNIRVAPLFDSQDTPPGPFADTTEDQRQKYFPQSGEQNAYAPSGSTPGASDKLSQAQNKTQTDWNLRMHTKHLNMLEPLGIGHFVEVDEIDLAENERRKFWVRGFLCATVIWGVVLFLARVS